jgi:hypothetical protein
VLKFFFYCQGNVHCEFIPGNKDMYTDTLHNFRDMVRRKCPQKLRTNSWCLLHDNTPSHWSVLVKNFLAKNTVTTLEHPLYSLTWLQLVFTCSNWNQTWRDGAFVMLLTSLSMLWLPGMHPSPLQPLAEVYGCTRGLFLKEM